MTTPLDAEIARIAEQSLVVRTAVGMVAQYIDFAEAIRAALVSPIILRYLRCECDMCGRIGTGGTHCTGCDEIIVPQKGEPMSLAHVIPESWLPIESAPKDRNLLLTDGEKVCQGGWITDTDQGAEWEGQLLCAGWWSVDGGIEEPTHWQPLPAPPLPKGQSDDH